MSSRGGYHQVTTIIGVGIICMTIISFVYFARSNTSQPDFNTQLNYHELQSTYSALSKRYESLYEYKERLEKAYLNLKNEKAALIENDKNEKVEFTELKELYSKQVQTLQDDLKTCHDQLQSYILSSKNANAAAAAISSASDADTGVGNNELYKTHDASGAGGPQPQRLPILTASQAPFNQDSAALPQPEFNKHRNEPKRHGGRKLASPPFSGDAGANKATPSGVNQVKVVVDNHIVSNVLKEPIQSPIAQVPMEPAQPSSDPNQDLVGNVFI